MNKIEDLFIICEHELELMARLNAPTVAMQMNIITTLNGLNFKKWKNNVEDVLGCMNLDMALEEDEPPKPNKDCSIEEMSHFLLKHDK